MAGLRQHKHALCKVLPTALAAFLQFSLTHKAPAAPALCCYKEHQLPAMTNCMHVKAWSGCAFDEEIKRINLSEAENNEGFLQRADHKENSYTVLYTDLQEASMSSTSWQ